MAPIMTISTITPTTAIVIERYEAIASSNADAVPSFTMSPLSPDPDASSSSSSSSSVDGGGGAALVAVEVSVEVSVLVPVIVGVVDGVVGGRGSTHPVFRPEQGTLFILIISTQH